MARVFDTPTYENQTLFAIFNLTSIHNKKGRRHIDIYPGRFSDIPTSITPSQAFQIGFFKISDDVFADICTDDSEEFSSLQMAYSYAEGVKASRGGIDTYIKLVHYGELVADLLNHYPTYRVLTDFEATFEICRLFYSRELNVKHAAAFNGRSTMCDTITKELAVIGLAVCNLGSLVTKCVGEVELTGANDCHIAARQAAEAWEKMRVSGVTKDNKKAHDDLMAGGKNFKDFIIEGSKAAKMLDEFTIYKISIFYFFISRQHGKIFVLDYAHLDQVRALMRTWAGYEGYAHNYRILGGTRAERERFCYGYHKSFAWLVEHMEHIPDKRALAKYMKSCIAILQNDFHDHAEKMDLGSSKRSEALRAELKEIYSPMVDWHTHVKNSGVTDREANNIAYMHHLLPCPDAPPRQMFERVVEQMNGANKADNAAFDKFLDYCKASDAVKMIERTKGRCNVKTIPGYNIKETYWYKSILSSKPFFPPESEWGKFWIENVIPVPKLMDTWYTTVGDVTRVDPNKAQYDSILSKLEMNRTDGNELLYTLKNAPEIASGYPPDRVWDELTRGCKSWDTIAEAAAKAENTKYGKSVRETWSADAITREAVTEYDSAMIPMAAMEKGVTSRKSKDQVSEIFDRVTEYTVSKDYTIIASVDTKGWSPSADRRAWSKHHDYLFNMTTLCGTLTLDKILEGIDGAINKRGVIATRPLINGLFQGWTGTADSILNVHACNYSIRMGKVRKYLQETITGISAGLIDDAVQAIKFPNGTLKRDAQAAANMHLKTIGDTFGMISAQLNDSKTIYSSTKYIYLNRFHCEGSEVLADAKTFAKVDRDMNKRLSTIWQQVDTIFGGYSAASERGSDPVVCYAMAIFRSVELMVQTNQRLVNVDMVKILVLAFAPRSLGGWGFPHIMAFLTKEKVDSLTMFTGSMARLLEMITSKSMHRSIQECISAILSQDLRIPSAMSVLQDPHAVRSVGAPNIEGQVYRDLLDRMKAFCTSEIFQGAFKLAESTDSALAVDAFLKSYNVDAGILSAMNEAIPSSCIRGIIDKAHKADLLLNLFRFSIRSIMIKKIKRGSWEALDYGVNLVNSQPNYMFPIDLANHMQAATDIRNSYLLGGGFRIGMATIPDPGTMLARQACATELSMLVSVSTPTSACSDKDKRSNYANFYDGSLGKHGRKTIRSRGIFTELPAACRGMTPVQKCVIRNAQMTAYLAARVGVIEAADYWRTSLAIWGCPANTERVLPTFHIDTSANPKRFGDANTTHPIECFPNTYNWATVSFKGMAKVFDATQTSADMMSLLTVAKVIGLMTSASDGNSPQELHYAVTAASFHVMGLKYSDKPMSAVNREILLEYLDYSKGFTPSEFSSAYLTAIRGYKPIPRVDETEYHEFVGMSGALGPSDRGMASEVMELFSTSAISRIDLTRGFAIPKREPFRRPMEFADEMTISMTTTLKTKYQRALADNVNSKGAAIMTCLLSTLTNSLPGRLPDAVYLATPSELYKNIGTIIRSWEDKLKRAVASIYNLGADIRFKRSDVCDYFPYLKYDRNIVDALVAMNMTGLNDEQKKRIFCSLLMFSVGDLPTTKMYTSFAARNEEFMISQWRFAAQRHKIRYQAHRAEGNMVAYMRSLVRNAFYENVVRGWEMYHGPRAMKTALVSMVKRSLEEFVHVTFDAEDLVEDSVPEGWPRKHFPELNMRNTHEAIQTAVRYITRTIDNDYFKFDAGKMIDVCDAVHKDMQARMGHLAKEYLDIELITKGNDDEGIIIGSSISLPIIEDNMLEIKNFAVSDEACSEEISDEPEISSAAEFFASITTFADIRLKTASEDEKYRILQRFADLADEMDFEGAVRLLMGFGRDQVEYDGDLFEDDYGIIVDRVNSAIVMIKEQYGEFAHRDEN